MAEKLEDWLSGEVAELLKMSVGELSNTFFFRDPIRPTYIDHEHFYSPADGTILYQKVVQPNEQVLEIKGIDYTIQDVMGDSEYNKPSLVIGIFMSFYDVHINRIPYGGVLKYKHMEPIIFNLSEYMKSGAMLSCMVMHLNRVDHAKSLL